MAWSVLLALGTLVCLVSVCLSAGVHHTQCISGEGVESVTAPHFLLLFCSSSYINLSECASSPRITCLSGVCLSVCLSHSASDEHRLLCLVLLYVIVVCGMSVVTLFQGGARQALFTMSCLVE